jgi:carbonic anhydrase
MVFDQGIGDLFVVRIAGNVAGRSQVASIEFAASYLGIRLVVVLGHTDCGAVRGVVDCLGNAGSETSASLDFFIEKIRPSVERVIDEVGECAPEKVAEEAVRENVRHSVDALQAGSEVIRSLVENDGLQVVGAEYSLRTGTVEFI